MEAKILAWENQILSTLDSLHGFEWMIFLVAACLLIDPSEKHHTEQDYRQDSHKHYQQLAYNNTEIEMI